MTGGARGDRYRRPGLPQEDDRVRPLSRWMRGTTTLVLLGVLMSLLPAAEAAQGTQGLQDGWAVGDQGQIAGGQLLSDEVGYMQQAGAGWVRVNFRLGQCFTHWTAVGCNGQPARVVSGGLLGLDSGGTHRGAHNGFKAKAAGGNCPSTVPSGGDYLCSTYTMGWKIAGWIKGAAPFDAVGQHLYINQGTTTSSNTVQKYLNDLRKIYTNYGGEPTSKQTQGTEVGWSTGPVSPRFPAQNLQIP